jgi:hypothetical protein
MSILNSINWRKYSIQRKKRSPSVNDIKFCIDFVVESALAFPEFDFDVEKAEES